MRNLCLKNCRFDLTSTETREHFLPPYLDHSGQSKVGHLADTVLSHQDVSSRQISVDAVLLLQVCHPISHLGTHVDEWRHFLILPLWTWNRRENNQHRESNLKEVRNSKNCIELFWEVFLIFSQTSLKHIIPRPTEIYYKSQSACSPLLSVCLGWMFCLVHP